MHSGVPTAIEVRAAYQHCEQITRTQARNFSYGIRLLPAGKRRALSAVYAFARRVDDIGDGSLAAPDKLAALAAARASVAALSEPDGDTYADPVLVALADAGRRFAIPLGAFGELIDGCEADVRGRRYAAFGELHHYCRCVAGSIGRLSLGVFGCEDVAVAAPLADALGVALQLTNILRDVREDYGAGRVYLPAEDLERFGAVLVPGDSKSRLADSRLEDVVRFEAERARGWYATGLQLMPMLDRRSAACAGAMAGIYFRLLGHISASPAEALQRRLSLSAREKAMVAARSLAGRTPAVRPPGPMPRVISGPGSAGMSDLDAVAAGGPRGAAAGRPHGSVTGAQGNGALGGGTVALGSGAAGRDGAAPAPRVIVIGGGLAGISAAIALREMGAGVTLLEARPRLGGATCSFSRGGLTIDNGQHVFLRCCSAYRGLLARLGMTGSAPIQDRFDIAVLSPGAMARLRRTALPGPLQLGRALAGYSLLSPAERLRAGRAALAMRFVNPRQPGVDGQRLGDWLAARGQGEHARRSLWDLFIVSALNIAGDDASLALAATVVKMALLGARDAADIGVPAIPLGELHGTAAARLLQQLGAEVRLATTAVTIAQGPAGRLSVRAAAGADRAESSLAADGVVIAVPPGPAARLMPAAAGDARWAGLGSSPIVNVHVIYDRRITRLPFAAGVDSPVQWVFDKTASAGLEAGQYLAVSLSAADEHIDVPAARLREQFVPALEELFPAARQARITDFFVTRERQATFRQAPGCARLRPAAATGLPGLVLAGAWTDTGWPDTMEGAVRSGLNAARELTRGLAWPPSREHLFPAGASAPAGAGAPS